MLECIEIMLQQYLPFTVLKRLKIRGLWPRHFKLQQYLPFTVLKLNITVCLLLKNKESVATVLTVYGIETH